jgi:hypothetical protein
MKKCWTSALITGFFLFAIVAMANAAPTLNVDFGYAGDFKYNGLGAAPDSPTSITWNHLDFYGGNSLLYSDGTSAKGIGVSTMASQSFSDGDYALVGDRIFVVNSWDKFTVTVSGLNDGLKYNLYAYGSHPSYASTYTVGTISDYALGKKNDYPFLYHDNYALLSQISPTDGKIVINVDRYPGSSAAVIGGFQLQATPVPIPPSILLLAPGLLGLIGFKRKYLG